MYRSPLLIIANGEPPSPALVHSLLPSYPTWVAIDGGLAVFEKLHLAPHLILGDFDSCSPTLLKKYTQIPQIHLPSQDQFDLEKSLEYLSPFSEALVIGALGKRLDHTLANLLLLARYPLKLRFQTEQEICFATPSSMQFPCLPGQTISLIPLSPVIDLTTIGLQWNLSKKTLNKQSISLSNVTISHSVSLNFEQGDLLICLQTEI